MLSDNPDAVLVDVRTDAEWKFVGVPDVSSLGRDVVFIEWNATDGTRNERLRRRPAGRRCHAGRTAGDLPVSLR